MASTSISVKSVPLVIDFLARNLLKLGSKFCCAAATVCLDDTDNNVLAATAAPYAFAEHAEGLADARCIPEKDLKSPAFLLRFAALQPIFR